MNQTIADDESLVIDLGQLYHILMRQYKLVIVSSVLFATLGILFALFTYQEKFLSKGTLIFTGSEPSNVVTTLQVSNRLFDNQGADASPLKNQERLLSSRRLALDVFRRLKQTGTPLPIKNADMLLDRVISVNQVKGTNFIEVAAVTTNPKTSQKVVQVYMDAYQDLVDEVTLKPLRQQRELFQSQVSQAELELIRMSTLVEDYQRKSGIVDIATESQKKVLDLENLNSSVKELEASLAGKSGLLAQVHKQLRMKNVDSHTALNAVANGQNSLLSDLQSKLQDAEKDYQVKSKIFAATNPDMVDLEEKINVLRKQIVDQQMVTVGQSADSKTVVIKDPIRSGLVGTMASTEGDISGLRNRLAIVRRQRGEMLNELKNIPGQQLEYARLLLEKKNKEDVLTSLKQKLAEVQIQESASQRKVQTMDEPVVSSKPLFPNRIDIISFSALAGFLVSSVGVVGHGVLTQSRAKPEIIEKLGLQVLSVIPWLSEEKWNYYRKRRVLEVTAYPAEPTVLKAYQDLALNLKAQRKQLGKNTFVVSSILQESGQSVILSNLGFCLAQSGEQVLLIDTNLRRPHLHESFNHDLDYENGLPELINSISGMLYRSEQSGQTLDSESLAPLIRQTAKSSGIHPQLHYLNAGIAMDNIFEFLNSKGFTRLLESAKASYDWILLYTPPFLEVPDASVLLASTDGLLLLIDKESDEAQVQSVKNKVERLNSSIVGTILRPAEI